MVNNLIITQARVGSKRLPSKVLMDINGQSLLELHLKRLKESKNSNGIVLATTFEKDSSEIIKNVKKINVSIFQGDTNNVLDRFYKVSIKFKPNYIVRVTSDCPLIDSKIIDELLEIAIRNKLDYVSNILIDSYPDGQDVEVISYNTLEKCFHEASLKSDKEHVTPYIRRNSSFNGGAFFSSMNIKSEKDYSKVRMTVDEIEDYNAIKLLVKKLGIKKGWKDYAKFIINNPNLFRNQDKTRNEGYMNSLKFD